MNRRTFLKMGGMTAATALLDGCQSGNEKLIPLLIPPDEGVTPGAATWYASSCTLCPSGCGIQVRITDGRAKKIEGAPDHPVNRGRLCALGQAGLQELYHPDRIHQPLQRIGPRGSGQFRALGWPEAITMLSDKLKILLWERSPHKLALLTPPLSGSLEQLTGSFMTAFGSPLHLTCELATPDVLRQANLHNFGQAVLPFGDLAETRYLLSFGADFIDGYLSPVQYGNAFGRMRQARDTVRGHFTYIGGRLSLTAASADRWLPVKTGSEAALALGMVRLILSEALFDSAALARHGLTADELLKQLRPYDPAAVADLCGLSQEAIIEVTREFATTRPSLAMAGETLTFHSNGMAALEAVNLLNVVVGNVEQPGGIYPAGERSSQKSAPLSLASTIKLMQSGQIKVALINGNPRHSIPPATGFQKALDNVPFTVSCATLLDETALYADLILPGHSGLESWGDVIPRGGSRREVYGVIQPVVAPLYDTRQFCDVLLAVAAELGGSPAAALPWRTTVEVVQSFARQRRAPVSDAAFESQWLELLTKGWHAATELPAIRTLRWSTGYALNHPEPPRFTGEPQQYPLQLHVHVSTAFHDGRGAAFPWLQQLPDPMSTVVWDSWLELHPATAASLGISHGDLVEVSSVHGTLRLAAVIYPGIRPELVALPLGHGQQGTPRNRIINPLILLTTPPGSEQPAWNTTMVRVQRISHKGELVTAGHPEGSYRGDLIGM
jgi:anaerobic selenocysteine-containing dehydrogenase